MMYDRSRAQQPGQTARFVRASSPGPEPLIPSDERDEPPSASDALNTFADSPREALEEAETAFDEVTAQLMSTLAERRRLLHATWRGPGPGTSRKSSGTR